MSNSGSSPYFGPNNQAKFTDNSGASVIDRIAGKLQKSDDGGVTFTDLGSGGLSSDTTIPALNGSGVVADAARILTTLTGITGAEYATVELFLKRLGALQGAVTFDAGPTTMHLVGTNNASNTDSVVIESIGNFASIAFLLLGAQMGRIIFDSAHNFTIAPDGTGSVLLNHRLQLARSATVTPVATTIQLPYDGDLFPLSVGTGTLNSIFGHGDSMRDGTVIWLEVPSGVTITNNVAGTGDKIFTPTGASIVTAFQRVFNLVLTPAGWQVTG